MLVVVIVYRVVTLCSSSKTINVIPLMLKVVSNLALVIYAVQDFI